MASLGPVLELYGVPDVGNSPFATLRLVDYQLKKSGPDNDICLYRGGFLYLQIGPLNYKAAVSANKISVVGSAGDVDSSLATGYFAVKGAAWPLNMPRNIRFFNWSASDTTGLVIIAGFDNSNESTAILNW